MCIWDLMLDKWAPKKWWLYIEKVQSECLANKNIYCAKRAALQIGINTNDVNECVAKSFTCDKEHWKDENCRNTRIDTELELWRSYGSNIWPSVNINN